MSRYLKSLEIFIKHPNNPKRSMFGSCRLQTIRSSLDTRIKPCNEVCHKCVFSDDNNKEGDVLHRE